MAGLTRAPGHEHPAIQLPSEYTRCTGPVEPGHALAQRRCIDGCGTRRPSAHRHRPCRVSESTWAHGVLHSFSRAREWSRGDHFRGHGRLQPHRQPRVRAGPAAGCASRGRVELRSLQSDGGTISIDFTPPFSVCPEDDRPMLICVHGLTGGSHESSVCRDVVIALTPQLRAQCPRPGDCAGKRGRARLARLRRQLSRLRWHAGDVASHVPRGLDRGPSSRHLLPVHATTERTADGRRLLVVRRSSLPRTLTTAGVRTSWCAGETLAWLTAQTRYLGEEGDRTPLKVRWAKLGELTRSGRRRAQLPVGPVGRPYCALVQLHGPGILTRHVEQSAQPDAESSRRLERQ